ncbi:MAG TPA: ABC transporter permease [Terriglobales bacterium]|nr:ABC transporter permease [Terriglobales bacterium]
MRALRYLFARLLYTLPVLWLVVSVVFLLIHLVPGDPILQMLGEGAPVTDVAATRHVYGLDVPLWQQYLHYWKGVLHGDLGPSLRFNQSVGSLIVHRYPYTLELTVASLFIAILISIPAGVRSAQHRGRWDDKLLSVVSLFGLSFPNFALGPILILFFAIKLGLLPVSGSGTFAHLVLPAITMGGALAAILTRMVRTSMLEELGHDYVRTARAKGLPERTVVYRHALRNAMLPIITVLGLQFGALLAGAIVTEKIFSWPGIGRLTIDAIGNRDYFLVQGCILAIGLTYVLVNFMTDLLYSVANPRIRQ